MTTIITTSITIAAAATTLATAASVAIVAATSTTAPTTTTTTTSTTTAVTSNLLLHLLVAVLLLALPLVRLVLPLLLGIRQNLKTSGAAVGLFFKPKPNNGLHVQVLLVTQVSPGEPLRSCAFDAQDPPYHFRHLQEEEILLGP